MKDAERWKDEGTSISERNVYLMRKFLGNATYERRMLSVHDIFLYVN